MKKIGVVSYNIHCNFTNYGSALQSFALNRTIKKLGYYPILIDYCPDILKDKNPLNPFDNIWDTDVEIRKLCELSMPDIQKNYLKFENFYTHKFNRSKPYFSSTFNDSSSEVDSYVCGSDTIFCPDEFGVDDGYYANYKVMKQNAISYAASFGDPHFSKEELEKAEQCFKNFQSIGIRENMMLDFVKSKTSVPVQQVIDPTLLLEPNEYDEITEKQKLSSKYVLYYSRRYNPVMEQYVEQLANSENLRIVEISLKATNKDKGHIMKYDAGVEEFLCLVKNAEYIVTNSYHGMIFSIIFQKQFTIFSRQQCDNKILEFLNKLGLDDRIFSPKHDIKKPIKFDNVHKTICKLRNDSLAFLSNSLKLL